MATMDRDRTEALPVAEPGYGGRFDHPAEREHEVRRPPARERGWMDPPAADETKPFFWTSEFLTLVLGTTAVAVCTAVFDNLDVWEGLVLITALCGAYMLSRGLAKAGTRHVDRGAYGR